MRNLFVISAVCLMVSSAWAAKMTVAIDGMTCQMCVKSITGSSPKMASGFTEALLGGAAAGAYKLFSGLVQLFSSYAGLGYLSH